MSNVFTPATEVVGAIAKPQILVPISVLVDLNTSKGQKAYAAHLSSLEGVEVEAYPMMGGRKGRQIVGGILEVDGVEVARIESEDVVLATTFDRFVDFLESYLRNEGTPAGANGALGQAKRGRFGASDLKKAQELREQGKTLQEIAFHLNRTEASVTKALEEADKASLASL